MLVKQSCVLAQESDLALLIYGDSITEPEGYFPTADFPASWTQLIMGSMAGTAMSSGRGGTTITELLERIKNELPFVKAKYVMVTIGTNGGNTEENLSELVEYIQRSEEHTSELQSLMRISYAVFCLKNKNTNMILQPINI